MHSCDSSMIYGFNGVLSVETACFYESIVHFCSYTMTVFSTQRGYILVCVHLRDTMPLIDTSLVLNSNDLNGSVCKIPGVSVEFKCYI